MKEDTSSKIRTLSTVISIIVVAVSFIAWVSSTGLQAEKNAAAIDKISIGLADEIQCRAEEDDKLKESISTQAIETQKSFTEIKVKLTGIDSKLDTNLTYLVKAFDREQEEK